MTDAESTKLQRALLIPARRPMRTLLVAAVVVVLALLSASRIEPVPSLEPMFPRNTPAARSLVRLLNDFSAADSLMLLVRAPQSEMPDNPEASLLAFADRLAHTIQQDDSVAAMTGAIAYRTDDLPQDFMRQRMVPAGLYYLDGSQFEKLKQRLTREQIEAQIRRNEALIASASPTADALSQRILQDPLRLHEFMLDAMQPAGPPMGDEQHGAFIGEDGRTLLIQIHARQPASELEFTKSFMQTMRRTVNQAQPGDLDVQYGGAYPIAELSERVIRRDMIRSVVLSIVLLQVVFLVAYRNLWSFPLTFLPVAMGIAVGFGAFAFYTQRLTPVTGAAGAILAGLGIDYCIHYVSHYQSRRGRGDGPNEAAHTSLTLAPALAAACVTSLIGFGAIAASSVPALRDFALVGALGLGGAFLGALFVLPALLRLHDRPGGRMGEASLRFHFEPMMQWIARHSTLCITLCTLGFIAGLALLAVRGPSGFDSSLTVMHPRPSPPMQAQEQIAAQFPGAMDSAHIHLEADAPRELLIKAHQVDAQLRSEAMQAHGVAAPLSLAQLLPDPRRTDQRRNAIQSLNAERIINDFRAAVEDSAFSLEAYEGYIEFLHQLLRPGDPPDVTALAAYPELGRLLLPRTAVGPNAAPATQAVTVVRFDRRFESDAARLRVLERIESTVNTLPGVAVTGMDLVSAKVRTTIEHDLPRLLTAAAVLVGAWLIVVYRHPGRVALTLIPATFAMVMLLAVMAMINHPLNLVSTVALPLLVGIGVDDGIFLVTIARRQRTHREAMVNELAASCHAITMTSLTTAVAFGSLVLTRTPAIQSLGGVLAVGMIGCWVGSVFLLAPLLVKLLKFAPSQTWP